VYNWPGITEAEERMLYLPETYTRTEGLAYESLRQELQPYLKYEQARRIDYFGLMNMDLRHFGHYLTFYRSRLDIRHPYFDYDLLDYVWRIKPAFREHRRLQKAVLNRLDPSLALVPIDKDETLPTDRRIVRGAHALAVKARRRFNKHVFPIFRDRFTLHTDYEGWLRTDLREWAQAILFDQRTLDRGIFNPDFIRSIWARHQSGREQWTLGKIAPILTYEMMLRELYDAP
jgi:asparagine synthase (glutamine-hydrolysing)